MKKVIFIVKSAQKELIFLKEKIQQSDESQRNFEEVCKYLRKSYNETNDIFDK
jgi:hypothetical protein